MKKFIKGVLVIVKYAFFTLSAVLMCSIVVIPIAFFHTQSAMYQDWFPCGALLVIITMLWGVFYVAGMIVSDWADAEILKQ